MTQSDSNRLKMRYSAESAWGETPSSPAMTELRLTSESLSHNKTTVTSETIRADRQRDSVLETAVAAEGTVEVEFAYGDYEGFLASAFRNSISETTVSVTSATVTASAIQKVAGGFDAFDVGQSVRLFAAGAAIDGLVVEVASATADEITFVGTPLAATTADVAIVGRTLVNGVVNSASFLLEADHEDISGVRWINGTKVNRMEQSLNAGEVVTTTFEFMGKMGETASTTVAGSTTPAGTNVPMTASVNVGSLREAGVDLVNAVQSISWEIANNMRERRQIGSKYTAEHGDGVLDVTGSMEVYFEDTSLYRKVIDHTDTSLQFRLTDIAGNVVVLTFPRVVLNGNPSVGGSDQDVMLPLDFTAYRDATQAITVRADFLPADNPV